MEAGLLRRFTRMSDTKLHGLAKNLCGLRYGRLVVQSLYSKEGRHYIWNSLCNCGNTCKVKSRHLLGGNTKSCGCLNTEVRISMRKNAATHNKSKTKEYRAWVAIKDRCTNPNYPGHNSYKLLGIDQEIKEDFLCFLNEIGEVPDSNQLWSVGRIDNSKGYYKGNIRWENSVEQARNRGMAANNTSGATGVTLVTRGKDATPISYKARWTNLSGKPLAKCFSINKYGDELAFFMACTYREHQIDLLNLQGAGYAKDHGKAGYNAKGATQ